MAGFGDAIKYLYEKFILRDMLSFVTPGAIVVLTAFLIFLPEPSLRTLFQYSRSMYGLLYIPLFGLFYITGFAIECLGRILGFMQIHRLDRSHLWERVRVFRCGWEDKHDKIWNNWKKAQEEQVKLSHTIKQHESDWAQLMQERLIVLKQMSVSGAIAIFIAGVFIAVSKLCSWSYANVFIVSLVAFLLLASLYWGYRWANLALDTVEQEIPRVLEKSNQENKKES